MYYDYYCYFIECSDTTNHLVVLLVGVGVGVPCCVCVAVYVISVMSYKLGSGLVVRLLQKCTRAFHAKAHSQSTATHTPTTVYRESNTCDHGRVVAQQPCNRSCHLLWFCTPAE